MNTQFNMPQVCCSCLSNDASESVEATDTFPDGYGNEETLYLTVPLCKTCRENFDATLAANEKKRLVSLIVTIVATIIALHLYFQFKVEGLSGEIFGSLILSIIAGGGAGFLVWRNSFESIFGDWKEMGRRKFAGFRKVNDGYYPKFKNSEFQEQFDSMN